MIILYMHLLTKVKKNNHNHGTAMMYFEGTCSII